MKSLFRSLLAMVLSFCMLHLQLAPVHIDLKIGRDQAAASLKIFLPSISLNQALAQGSGSGSGGSSENCIPKDQAGAATNRAKVCDEGTYKVEEEGWIGGEQWYSFILLLAAAVTVMFMMVGCKVSNAYCGYAPWAAAIGALALLVGEIISTVKQNTIYKEIEYNATNIKKNKELCDAEGAGEDTLGCEQYVALKSQHEALDSLHSTLLIKVILYGAATAAFLTAMIIELTANTSDLTEHGVLMASIAAINNGAIRSTCSAACAALTVGAPACVASLQACAVGIDAATVSINGIEAFVQAPICVEPSGARCQQFFHSLQSVCPTAATPNRVDAPVPVCIGVPANPPRAACLAAMATSTGCQAAIEPLIQTIERKIEQYRCTIPSAGAAAAAALSQPFWSILIFGPIAPPVPTPSCRMGCNLTAAVTENKSYDLQKHENISFNKPEAQNNEKADLINTIRKTFKISNQDEQFENMFASIDAILNILIPKAHAASKEESWVSSQAPWLKGFGFGITAILLVVGLIWMSKIEGDFFFASPSTRAIFYGIISGLAAIALGIGIKTMNAVADQRDKVDKIIKSFVKLGDTTNATKGQALITSVPDGGFGLEGLDGDLSGNPDAPTNPCPFGGDGKGNCIPRGEVSDSKLVNTPFAGMGGLANSLSKTHNGAAGRKGISKEGLGAANKLAGAAKGLKKKVALLKKNLNDRLRAAGFPSVPFDKLERDGANRLFASAQKVISDKGITPQNIGGSQGGVSKDLLSKMSDEAKGELAKVPTTGAASIGAIDPFANMNMQEEQGATVDLGDNGAAAMNDLDIKVDDITNDEHGNIFELLSMRYKKSAYPVLFEEVK